MTSERLLDKLGPRESMEYDVVIVGAGPAGLAAAIRLRQRAQSAGRELSVVVLEKGSEPGAHTLSGAVMDPIALDELIPDWRALGAPLLQPVTTDHALFLTARRAFATPHALIPSNLDNKGCYVISLSDLVRWLAEQAEALGVEVFSGFAATEVLFDDQGRVRGVATGDMGVDRSGAPTERAQRGVELIGKYTLFAEGSRGHLGKQLIETFALDKGKDPQSYAIGIKELWEIEPSRARPGEVVHAAGWPLDARTYGGGFLYHLTDNKVALGYVVGLDYTNPWLSPFEELQRWKTHPAIRAHIEGGRRIGYGARSITAGGLLSLPKLVFPGGALIGCEAGFLNAPRIKGSHAAIKTGLLAADATFDAVAAGRNGDELCAFPRAFEDSWLHAELMQARNWKQWFKWGLVTGSLMTAVEFWLLPRLGFRKPFWTLHRKRADHENLRPSAQCRKIVYPKPDGKLSFDRLSSVFLSNTHHAENQPSHLKLKDVATPIGVNLARFAGPESRYCPAGVYEFVEDEGGADRLQVNAQNCLHCKTCDIKDPTLNIVWVPPEGGGGPNYSGM
jgi:electron-transferring-flavoprotein dehydrogenase